MSSYKWYDHPLVWDFYDNAFGEVYNDYYNFIKASWKVDVFEGVDGELVFINSNTTNIPVQIKTSKKQSLYDLKLNLAYINENGDPSAFGLYFNDDRIDKIEVFVFGFPFLGIVLLVDFNAFWYVWMSNFDKWVTDYGQEKGLNKYISIPFREVLGYINDNDYIIIHDLEPIRRKDLK